MKTIASCLTTLLFFASCSTTKPKPAVSIETARCLSVKVSRIFDGDRARDDGPVWITMDTESVRSFSNEPNSDCATLDAQNLVVLPGLTDGHTHVFLEDETFGRDTSGELERQTKKPESLRRSEASDRLQSLLRSGFTAIRDLGNSGQYLDVEFRDSPLSANYPRIFASGPGIATGTAQFPATTPKAQVAREYTIVKSIGDVERAIKERDTKGVSLVKIYADNEPQPGLTSQDLLDAAVKFAHQRDLKITAHATNDVAARRALRAGVDSIEHGNGLQSETLAEMSERRILLVPTDFGTRTCTQVTAHAHDDAPSNCGRERADDTRRLLAARDRAVDVAFGSDMYLILDGDLKGRGASTLDSLVAYVDEGLTPMEAIRSATTMASKLTGDEKLGVLKVGSYPDLVAYEDDPLRSIEAIRKPKLVIKGGRIVCGIGAPRGCE